MSACCTCSCGCGCTPGYGCLITYVPTPDPDAVYSAANVNVNGVGVYDGQTANEFDFRGIAAGNTLIAVALDAGNKSISLTPSLANIVAGFPAATTAQVGILETSTDAEAQAKVATDKTLTPSNLAALASTLTFAGLIEIATSAETITGTDATRAVSPAGLAALTATQKVTTTFANAVARAAAVPAFEGQFGGQLDSNIPYYATGAGAGAWGPVLLLGNANNATDTDTTLDISAAATILVQSLDSTGIWIWNDVEMTFLSTLVTFDNASINFELNSDFQIAGNPVPGFALLATSPTGQPNYYLTSQFLSDDNVQTYIPTNFSTTRSFDAAAGTLQQAKDVLATLLNDLINNQKPGP